MVINEILDYFKSAVTPMTSLPVVGENEKATSQFHVRLFPVPTKPKAITLGAAGIIDNLALIEIDVFAPVATGSTANSNLIGSIIAANPRGIYQTSSGTTFQITHIWQVSSRQTPIDKSANSFVSTMFIEIQYFSFS